MYLDVSAMTSGKSATLLSLWNKHEFTNTFKFVGTHIKAFGKVEWNDGKQQAREQHIQSMHRSKTKVEVLLKKKWIHTCIQPYYWRKIQHEFLKAQAVINGTFCMHAYPFSRVFDRIDFRFIIVWKEKNTLMFLCHKSLRFL